QVALAAVVIDGDALAAGDDRRRDARAVLGEVQPKIASHGARERNARVGPMTSTQVTEFEALRPHLMSVAYRLTGTVADAEDIVQEAWLRWYRQDSETTTAIADLRAWLTTVVSRLGLDRLRSAAHRRESYTGHWLPEPVVTGLQGFQDANPLSAV